jgi:putative transposase
VTLVEDLGQTVGVKTACKALNVPRASFYRARAKSDSNVEQAVIAGRSTRSNPRALKPEERAAVLDHLHSERFVDVAPETVYATLLDEETYICSPRTMYRILEENKEVRERRNQLSHPTYSKPELIATAPNQVWSWDITKLRGPAKWTYFYLYVILDIFSRYVVGWMIAHSERSALAKRLIDESCAKEAIEPDQLTIHADRGSSMTSKPVAFLLADLGVTKSHSRPYTSNDNPFSESHFKTLKYRPDFPDRFASIDLSRDFCRTFFSWYNMVHRHSGIGFLTPHDVHHGLTEIVLQNRGSVLDRAYLMHPERFVNGPPKPTSPPDAVFINPPDPPTSSGSTSEDLQ